jgi:hypothetical protein
MVRTSMALRAIRGFGNPRSGRKRGFVNEPDSHTAIRPTLRHPADSRLGGENFPLVPHPVGRRHRSVAHGLL